METLAPGHTGAAGVASAQDYRMLTGLETPEGLPCVQQGACRAPLAETCAELRLLPQSLDGHAEQQSEHTPQRVREVVDNGAVVETTTGIARCYAGKE